MEYLTQRQKFKMGMVRALLRDAPLFLIEDYGFMTEKEIKIIKNYTCHKTVITSLSNVQEVDRWNFPNAKILKKTERGFDIY
jgi:hypothetical protein